MLRRNGIPTSEDIARIKPPSERRARGPVVWVECFEEIPCDPCHDACPVGAIAPFEDINHTPTVNHDACTGCGLCVSACPGLAIFIIDETYSQDEAVIRMPYEFRPLPQEEEVVPLMNRAGEKVGTGEVLRVQNPPTNDRTAVVWVVVPKTLVEEVRAIGKGVPLS